MPAASASHLDALHSLPGNTRPGGGGTTSCYWEWPITPGGMTVTVRSPPGHSVSVTPRPARAANCGRLRPGTGRVRHVELRVSSRTEGDHTVVSLAGEIDLYTAPHLQSELAATMGPADPAQIVVDMSEVEFCDSTGMNVLLAAHRQASERGGGLALAQPRASVRKVLEVTGLASVFTVHDDLRSLTGQ